MQALTGTRLAGRWSGRAWTRGDLGDRARGLAGWLDGRLAPDQHLAVGGEVPDRIASTLAVIWSGGVVVLDGSTSLVLMPPSRLPALRRGTDRWVPPARLRTEALPARRKRIDGALLLADGTLLSHAALVERVGSADPVHWLAQALSGA